jgi:arylsulfatase A-like enzyme
MKLHRIFLTMGMLLLAGSSAPAGAQTNSLASLFTNVTPRHTVVPRRASVIFLAFHGLGLGDLSCYGQTNFQTPNLDRLAAGGTRFNNYRVTGDDMAQVQAALMAGNTAPFSPASPTLAGRLQAVGYYTVMSGEWILGPQPWTQGFDDFGGFLSTDEARNYYSDFFWRYAPKAIYDSTNRTRLPFSGREEIYANTGGQKGQYLPDFFMKAVAQYARVSQPDFANHYRPFFVLASQPAPVSATPGKDDYPVPTDAPYSSEPWPQAARNRAALITRLDDGVGRLLEQLNKLGMTNNVVIFVTGAAAPEKYADTNLNFLKIKGEVRGGTSPERLRVPMIAYWPGHIPAGRVCDEPWDVCDVAPTILEIAYGKPSPDMTGISRLPLLLGQEKAPAAPPERH